MATYGEIVTRILDDLSRPDDEIGDAARREVLSAIDFYSSERFAFNERILTISLSTTRDYAFSLLVAPYSTSISDLWAIDGIKVGYSGRNIMVDPDNWGRLWELDQSNITSNIPDLWATFNKTLRIYPSLTTTLSAEMAAHVNFIALLNTGDTNPWLDDGEELVRSRACRMICQRKLRAFDRANEFKELEREALQALRMDAATLQSTGMLKANW